MFQRGQKIIILKSSAKTRGHPNAGDIGYLNNIYLFPEHRFILLDGFFFCYKSDKRDENRSERKKFIIDLGMQSSFRYKISHQGVPANFFVHNNDAVNLSSVGYHLGKITPDSLRTHLLDYPLLCGNWGIWSDPKKKSKNGSPVSKVKVSKSRDGMAVKVKDEVVNKVKNKLIKIPHGQIALASTRSNSRYRLETCGENEFQAWLQSVLPAIASMLEIFCGYTHYYALNRVEGGCFDRASAAYSTWIKPYLVYTVLPSAVSYYLHRNFDSVTVPVKKEIVKNVNLLRSLTNTFLSRLDFYFINRLGQGHKHVEMDYVSEVWAAGEFLCSAPRIPEPVAVYYQLLRSIFFRNLLTDTSHGGLKLLMNYLPKGWAKEADLKAKAKIFGNIRRAGNSDSAALNRIYEILK